MEKIRAAAYCRVSSDSDAQDGSFETQVEYYRDKLSASDHKLVEVYGDHGSGREMAVRPAFQRMIADCEAGKIDVIYSKSISRFARNMAECTTMIRHLRELGVTLVFEKEGLRTDAPGMELVLSIMATLAEEESHSISQNLSQIKAYKNSVGEPTEHPCYGYRKNGKGWRVEPVEAERIRLVFRMAAEGYTYDEMLREMNRLEQEQPTRKKWSKAIIRYMLLNHRYIGDYLTNKKVGIMTEQGRKTIVNDGIVPQYMIEDHHEAIISDELFEVVCEMVMAGVPRGHRKQRGQHDALIQRAKLILMKEAA